MAVGSVGEKLTVGSLFLPLRPLVHQLREPRPAHPMLSRTVGWPPAQRSTPDLERPELLLATVDLQCQRWRAGGIRRPHLMCGRPRERRHTDVAAGTRAKQGQYSSWRFREREVLDLHLDLVLALSSRPSSSRSPLLCSQAFPSLLDFHVDGFYITTHVAPSEGSCHGQRGTVGGLFEDRLEARSRERAYTDVLAACPKRDAPTVAR